MGSSSFISLTLMLRGKKSSKRENKILKLTNAVLIFSFDISIVEGGGIWILRLRLDWTSAFGVFLFSFFSFFFFFFLARVCEICGYCSCTVQWTVAAKFDFSIFFSQSVHIVHCSWTHKFHFSKTFTLKMSLTVLFTHLKIILLQYFSVFSFSFQLYPNRP